MKIEKTDAEAMEFADGLDNTNGDADLFIALWDRGEYTTIRGHFPAFAGAVVEEAEEAPPVAATKSRKSK